MVRGNKIFGRREKPGSKIAPILDLNILEFLEGAELLLKEDREGGLLLICEAEMLYVWRNRSPEIESRISDINFLYSMDVNDYSA